jgi:signal transduction histidine kinase/ligand-binding sensor domain-containing protein
MAEDKDGSMWVSYQSPEVPLCRIREGKEEALGPAAAGVSGTDETWLVRDPRGPIWFASGRQIGVLRDGRLVTLLTRERPVTCIAAAGRGGVWFSDGAGIWSAREDGRVEPLGEVPGGMVSVLHEDGRGQLWVACNTGKTGALFLHENKQFRQVPVVCPYVMALADDREGNLWVSTRRTGLIQVRLRTVELANPISDMLAGVLSVCEDRGGMRFAVGANGLLACSQGQAWREMTEPLGWWGSYAECVATDPLGGVWLGTREHGLMRWGDGVFSGVKGTDGPEDPWVRSLLPGSNKTLWFGTMGQRLYRLHDGRLTMFQVPLNSGYTGPGYVGALAEDGEGNVWAATQHGLLLRVHGESLVDETPQVSNPPDVIRCLHTTPDGSLWIGYSTCGLGRLKQGVFQRFSKDQGIEDKAVSQILTTDGDGWLWCAGDRGIFRVKLAELEAVAAGKPGKVHPVWCGRGEGWPVMQASCENWPRAARNRTGELCLPMVGGLAIIRPQRSLDHPPEPPVVLLDRLTVNGRCVAAYESGVVEDGETGEAGGPPPADLHGHSGDLSLGRGVRQLGIEYDVVSFAGRENVRFRYRMEGLDETWVEAGLQRVAYFSMLPPGRYRFHVTACNNHGVWNDTGTSLDFTVVPYYWQTRWFRVMLWLAAGTLIGGGIWMVVRRRLRQQLHAQALARVKAETEFSAIWNERNRMARELHDTLAQGLGAITMQLEVVKRKLPADSTARGPLDEARDQARSSLADARNSIWNMRSQVLETGDLATALRGILKHLTDGRGIAAEVRVTGQARRLAPVTENNLLRIGQEAITNAARYARASEIEVLLEFEARQLRLSVTDDGCGFDPAQPPVSEGGFGIVGMRERAAELHAALQVLSTPGQGTVMTLRLPLAADPITVPPRVR